MGSYEMGNFTVGVEEEYLTVDAASLELRPRGGLILDAARPLLGERVQAELNLAQIEAVTPVCNSIAQVEAEIRGMRSALSTAASACESAIAATGSHPDAAWIDQAITPEDRYESLEEDFQQLAREHLICGCHVHVGIDDPDDVIKVMDQVRSWVPTLLALVANSPFWEGVDTGYASYRTEVFDRWPTAGPSPVCGDREGYERSVGELVSVGMVPDETFVYWHLRPSGRYPTLELRVADVALNAEGAATLAALYRALVRACHGEPAPSEASLPAHEVVRAATWRACRYGLEDTLVDLVNGEELPAPELVRRLLAYVRPTCAEDEWDEMTDRVEAILAGGNGAARQRAAHRDTGSLDGVTRMIVDETAGRAPGAVGTPEPTTGATC